MTIQIHAIFTSNHHITSRNRTILTEQRAVWRGNFSLQEGTHFGFLTEWVNCANKKKDVLTHRKIGILWTCLTRISLYFISFIIAIYKDIFSLNFLKHHTTSWTLRDGRDGGEGGRGMGSMLDGGEDGGVEGSNKLRFKVLKGEGQAYV